MIERDNEGTQTSFPIAVQILTCEECGARGVPPIDDCLVDLEIAEGNRPKRPRDCVNAYDPKTAPIPF